MGKNNDRFVYENALKGSSDTFMQKIQFVDRYIDRPLASLVVRAVYHTRITPNTLTYISSFLGLLGAFFFSRGAYPYFLMGGILAELSSIVDGADGMLARAKNMGSDYGSHLDIFWDRILDFFILSGIAVGAHGYYHNPALSALGFFGAGLYLLQIHLFYQTKSYLRVENKGDNGEARAILYLGILICSVVNRLDICIYLLLIETVLVNVVRIIYFMSLRSGKR
ncbi:MAG: CDP-alcohol phosphatidyltransferase family protein [Candidatus Omnitrophota bacterium]